MNGWANNGEASDFRRYPAHYDVIVMYPCRRFWHLSPHICGKMCPTITWTKPFVVSGLHSSLSPAGPTSDTVPTMHRAMEIIEEGEEEES